VIFGTFDAREFFDMGTSDTNTKVIKSTCGLCQAGCGVLIHMNGDAHPDPVVWLHPDTAHRYGIEDGDKVDIETRQGRIRQQARVTGVDYAWCFPEQGSAGQYGWSEANINILTNGHVPDGSEVGTPTLRGILCKISKAKSK
jgi:anaerobic selenocysteine-containing dehydrogenase